jgi:D-beta-D-heptose 7-phosphate kinase/D-beta-D-heptose 1-phosphate adenosyltransferase
LESLSFVDEVFISIDSDKTVVKSIEAVFRNERASIFAKGGDRFIGEIPERKICDELGITIIDNLGKKIQSSSWLIGKQTP